MARRSRTPLSKAQSYREIGEFWDSHDLGNYWDETEEADFEVELESEATYYALKKGLSQQVRAFAKKEGVSADTLVNLWVQEKLRQEA
jgi:ribosomal protein S16